MTIDEKSTSRRDYLAKSLGAATLIGVAGCADDDGNGNGASADDDGNGDDGNGDVGNGDDSQDSAGYPDPDRTATNIVPYGEGGGTDTYARGIIPHVEDELGISIQISNNPGGESIVGVTGAYHAEPDGYTWVIHNLPTTALAWTLNPTDDNLGEMTPICQYGSTPYVWHADPDLGLEHDPQGVVDLYEDGEISQMGGNLGSGEHLAAAQIRENGDLPDTIDWIVYDGSGPQLQATASGEVPIAHATDAAAASAVDEGTVDLVAILGDNDSGVFPDAPNLVDDAGFGPHIGGIDRIAAGPPGIPDDIVNTIADAFKNAIEGPVQEWSEQTGNEVVYSPPEETAEMFNNAYDSAGEYTPLMDAMLEN